MKIWKRIVRAIGLEPSRWRFVRRSDRQRYVHGTVVSALAFTPDERHVLVAGGYSIPRADSSIALVDVSTGCCTRVLEGHVHGIYALDAVGDLVASASFDYSVHIWNIAAEDVIFLRGRDQIVRSRVAFSADGTRLFVGEDNYYSGDHSCEIVDLRTGNSLARLHIPDRGGVKTVCVDDGRKHCLFVTGPRESKDTPVRLYRATFDIPRFEAIREFSNATIWSICYGAATSEAILAMGYGTHSDDLRVGCLNLDTGAFTEIANANTIGAGVCSSVGADELIIFCDRFFRVYRLTDRTMLHQCEPNDTPMTAVAYSPSGKYLATADQNREIAVVTPSWR